MTAATLEIPVPLVEAGCPDYHLSFNKYIVAIFRAVAVHCGLA